jgi:hypothetical protein
MWLLREPVVATARRCAMNVGNVTRELRTGGKTTMTSWALEFPDRFVLPLSAREPGGQAARSSCRTTPRPHRALIPRRIQHRADLSVLRTFNRHLSRKAQCYARAICHLVGTAPLSLLIPDNLARSTSGTRSSGNFGAPQFACAAGSADLPRSSAYSGAIHP